MGAPCNIILKLNEENGLERFQDSEKIILKNEGEAAISSNSALKKKKKIVIKEGKIYIKFFSKIDF